MARKKEDVTKTSHFADIQKVVGLNVGEFHVIDQYKVESFRVTFVGFLHHNPQHRIGVRYKSVRVSKDKVYYFRVNTSQKMGIE